MCRSLTEPAEVHLHVRNLCVHGEKERGVHCLLSCKPKRRWCVKLSITLGTCLQMPRAFGHEVASLLFMFTDGKVETWNSEKNLVKVTQGGSGGAGNKIQVS